MDIEPREFEKDTNSVRSRVLNAQSRRLTQSGQLVMNSTLLRLKHLLLWLTCRWGSTKQCLRGYRRVSHDDDVTLECNRLAEENIKEQRIGRIRSRTIRANYRTRRDDCRGGSEGRWTPSSVQALSGWAPRRDPSTERSHEYLIHSYHSSSLIHRYLQTEKTRTWMMCWRQQKTSSFSTRPTQFNLWYLCQDPYF